MKYLPMFICLAICLSGCTGVNIGTPTAENVQARLDVLNELQEAYDLGELRPGVMSQISESADFLCDSEADKESLLSLNGELQNSAKDKDELMSKVSQMAKLIHLPEKYKDTFPVQK